jgi:GNAT superfamily N-acetyltransferase
LEHVPSQLLKPVPIVEGNAATRLIGVRLPGVDFEIRRIPSPGGLADVRAVEEAVWDEKMEWIHDHLGSYLRDYPELLSVYVAYVDGVPASAAWVFFFSNSPFASLWGGSTLSDQRGKGLYTALLAVRLQEAIRRGRRFLEVDASSMSRPILEKYNFRRLDYSTPCKWLVKK